jgi:type VI secretion system protein ImpF
MNQSNSRSGLLPSLLDRLIEYGDNETPADLSMRGQSLSEMQESVRRDLQDLLNTRQSTLESFSDEAELAQSVLTYGLPDLTTLNPTVIDQRKLLQQTVEQTIRRFEPRLMEVRVTAATVDPKTGRGLRLNVEALLRVAPAPLPISFDTVVEPGSSEWRVVDSGGK